VAECRSRLKSSHDRHIGITDGRKLESCMLLGVALGGVVVSVLATGPNVAGSNPAEDDGF
jgi:hypothetical protein